MSIPDSLGRLRARGTWAQALRSARKRWLSGRQGSTLLFLALWGIVSFGVVGQDNAHGVSGGALDLDERFGFVVAVSTDSSFLCSAVKVGATRFLTAAHCTIDAHTARLRQVFQSGGRIGVTNRAEARPGDALELRVSKTLVHPLYAEALDRLDQYREERADQLSAAGSSPEVVRKVRQRPVPHHFSSRFPDVALVFVRERTGDIPIAPISCARAAAGDEVAVVGYGLDVGGRASTRGEATILAARRWGMSRVIREDGVNFYSFGGLLDEGAATVGPGDSGGPVVRLGQVIGIHGVVYGLSRGGAGRSNMAASLAHAVKTSERFAELLCRAGS